MIETSAVLARSLRVTGVVQGVGFRPFVHRLALRYALAGSVRNVGGEVEIEVEGGEEAIKGFIAALGNEAPPLAQIESVDVLPAQPGGRAGFDIVASVNPAGRRQPVSPDVALCARCEAELLDPANRRFRYPFITCTDCGPRFTIIEAMPYDRARTSMRHFAQCGECAREYRTPGDRRYHSETNSCPSCGPRLWYEGSGAPATTGSEAALQAAASLLAGGGILAVRAMGGFQLAVDATSPDAVERLRSRKHRDAKPLAVMVGDLAAARTLAHISEAEAKLLTSAARPVVVARALDISPLAPAIAPGLDSVGVMLPSTPLHHLLLGLVRRPLVMTSGNVSEEPIAIGNDEARARLGAIADGFLLHDRDIISRYDDSVIRMARGRQVLLRRARGFAPLPLRLPLASPQPIVADGGDLKNTFTLVDGRRGYVSQHIGDLENLETVRAFHDALARFADLFQITPQVAARDLHPGYHSTRIANDLHLPTVIPVQHHHAHIAAVLAEHGRTDAVIGVAYDGTGYGDDGTIWGAEILFADLAGYRRIAHLRNAPLPGGDLAARQPWRAALGYLSLDPGSAGEFAAATRPIDPRERTVVEAQIAHRVNTPMASSMGRLFDAASAVLGVRHRSRYEGHAAMELEALAGRHPGMPLPFPLVPTGTDRWELDPIPLLIALGDRHRRGGDVASLAADFHASVIAATVQAVTSACESCRVSCVALGGGVFQNARLLSGLAAQLAARGLTVLAPRALSPNDGSISFGQAAVAGALLTGTGSVATGG